MNTLLLFLTAMDLHLSCAGRELKLEIPKLAPQTESGVTTLTKLTEDTATCQALRNYLRVRTSVQLSASVSVTTVDELLEIFPCVGDTCSARYQKARQESVALELKGVSFLGRKIVAGTQVERTETWDQRWCPPYAPDCDL